MREIPKPLEQYMHFKGKRYQILAIAKHSETMQQMVVYQALYGEYGVYVRPLEMFLSEVDHEKYPEVKQKYRFAHIGVDEVVLPTSDETNKKTINISEQSVSCVSEEPSVYEETFGRNDTTKDEEIIDLDDALGYEGTVVHKETLEDEVQLDPLLMEFLDANTTEERLNILTGLHCRITHEMINTMAVVLDLDVPDGDLEERYEQVKYALFTKKKYEGTRLR